MTPLDAAKLAQSCYIDTPTFGDPHSAGRVVMYGPIAAFPGSNNIACWLADLDVVTVSVADLGHLHQGFFDSWLLVKDVLDVPDIQITVGHSEGAALALICGAILCLHNRPPKQIFAFEPPRISTDDTIAQLLTQHNVDVRLYRKGEDVVPLVPRLAGNWQHPGTLERIGTPIYPFPNVDDHCMTQVIEALEHGSV